MPRNSSESTLEMAAEWQRISVLLPGSWIEASVASRFLGTSRAWARVLSHRSAFAKRDPGQFEESAGRRGKKQEARVSFQFPHRRLHLLEIEPHVHFAVHRRRGREV